MHKCTCSQQQLTVKLLQDYFTWSTQVILFLLRNSEDKINQILLFEIKEPFLKNN